MQLWSWAGQAAKTSPANKTKLRSAFIHALYIFPPVHVTGKSLVLALPLVSGLRKGFHGICIDFSSFRLRSFCCGQTNLSPVPFATKIQEFSQFMVFLKKPNPMHIWEDSYLSSSLISVIYCRKCCHPTTIICKCLKACVSWHVCPGNIFADEIVAFFPKYSTYQTQFVNIVVSTYLC